ncbi:hypothetical protein XMIN_1317 [Xanthomonas citri pv. mangiferaeindicae LMG 941]|nr:hypothetical protein XMIN_1317 [Xanthomonas citri pv. mangiferaeindicae LMG 941]
MPDPEQRGQRGNQAARACPLNRQRLDAAFYPVVATACCQARDNGQRRSRNDRGGIRLEAAVAIPIWSRA